MSSNSTSNNQGPSNDASTLDLAQAFKEIQRGEQTASQLEANLSSLEAKLDAMLAGLEQQEKEKHSEDAPETKVEEQKEISDEEKELKMDLKEADELKHIQKDQGEECTALTEMMNHYRLLLAIEVVPSMMPRVPDLCTKLSPSCHLEPGGTTGLSSASVTRIHITTTKRQQSRFSDRLHHGSITTSASQKPHDNLVLPTSPPSQPHQFSRPARRMIPQLSQLKSHLRKNTSEPANKPPEALTSPCSPPGPSRRNATSTPLTCSRPPTPLAPQLTSSRCKETRCTRHTSPRFPTPLSPPGTPAPPRGRVTPRASSRSPVQVNDQLRPRRSPTLRQPTRTKAEQAAHFQSIHDTEDEEWLPHPRLTAANLHRAQQIAEGGKRSPYTTYMFSTALPEPVRKRKPSLTQPTRTRAERVAAGDCMGHGCFSAFCATSCAFERPEPAYSLPQFVTMSTEPDIDQTLSKPKTNYSLWTSIKQIRPIDPTFSKSGKKESFRRFIKDLVDCLKACGKLLLVAVGCNCVLK